MDEASTLQDADYVAEKEHNFLGIARIDISSLTFEHEYSSDHRVLSVKAVRRLQNTFRIEGCLRLPEENHISAIVDRAAFLHAVSTTGLGSFEDLWKDTPSLIPLANVRCLHGLHRVRAADAVLEASDRWWTVRLYSSGRLKSLYMCSARG